MYKSAFSALQWVKSELRPFGSLTYAWRKDVPGEEYHRVLLLERGDGSLEPGGAALRVNVARLDVVHIVEVDEGDCVGGSAGHLLFGLFGGLKRRLDRGMDRGMDSFHWRKALPYDARYRPRHLLFEAGANEGKSRLDKDKGEPVAFWNCIAVVSFHCCSSIAYKVI